MIIYRILHCISDVNIRKKLLSKRRDLTFENMIEISVVMKSVEMEAFIIRQNSLNKLPLNHIKKGVRKIFQVCRSRDNIAHACKKYSEI